MEGRRCEKCVNENDEKGEKNLKENGEVRGKISRHETKNRKRGRFVR